MTMTTVVRWITLLLCCSSAYAIASETSQEAESANVVEDDQKTDSLEADEAGPDALIVTGTRTPQRRSDSPVLTEVISRKNLEAMGVNHLGDVLSLTGGLHVTQSYAGSSVALQGLDEKHTLVLIDGDRILGEKDGATDLSRINIEQIERVEIVRGAASALYGADALGGVVNIITRQTPKALKASTKLGYGSDSGREATAMIGGGVERYRLSLTGGVYQMPAYDLTPNDNNQTTHGSEMTDWHIDTKNEWRPAPRLKLTLGGRYENRSRVAVEERDNGRIFDRQQKGDFYDANLKMKYRTESSTRVSASLRASYLRDQFLLNQRSSDREDSYENSELWLYQASLQSDVPLPNNNLLSVGLDGIAETISSPRVSVGEYCSPDSMAQSCQAAERQRVAIFAQDSFTPLTDPYLTIVVGTRTELASNFGVQNVPRLAVRLDPVDQLKLRVSVGKGYRAPTFKELYLRFDNPSVGYTVRGNPNLSPERSLSYQASADWKPIAPLNLNVSAFRNEVVDLINYEQLASATAMNELDRYQLTNISSAYTQGVQTELRVRMTARIEASAGYQWLDTRDNEQERPLMNRAEHQAHGHIQVTHPSSGLSLTTSAVWVGKRYFFETQDDEDEELNSQTQRYTAEPFTNLNLNLRWIPDSWFGGFIRAENLLNTGDPQYASRRPRRLILGMEIGN